MKKFLIGFFAILATLAMIGCNNGGAAGIAEEDLLGNWLFVESTEGATIANPTVVYIFKDDGKIYSTTTQFLGDENQADYETETGSYTTSTAKIGSIEYDLSMTTEDDNTYLIFTYSVQCMKLEKIVEEE